MSTYIYATGQQHPSPLAHPIVAISLTELPQDTKSEDERFDETLQKLDEIVGDERYVLVVLAAGSDSGSGLGERGIGWWLSKWKSVPHKYRKNMKRLYLVHPSSFTRKFVPLLLPFLSPKAYAKFHPVQSLLELHQTYGVSLSGIRLPLVVLEEEARLRPDVPSKYPTPASWSSSFTSVLGVVGSYLPFSSSYPSTNSSTTGRGYWGRTIDELVEECDGVPPLFDELRDTILTECVKTEGIFRLTPGPKLRPVIVDLLDLPLSAQPILPWRDIAISDPLLPPKILSRLLSNSSTPFIRQDQYHLVRQCTTLKDTNKLLLPALSPATRLVLTHVVETLQKVSLHVEDTRMTPLNLAICIAPDLIRGPDPLEDAGMCLQPGRKMPQRAGTAGEGDGTVVGLLEHWIRDA